MTRRIAAHKGGRTARAPEARIRPQTLQRIWATMREQDKSFADLLEEEYGGNEMKYTVEVRTKNGNPISDTPDLTETQAKRTAKQAAKSNPNALVFVSWYRSSDGQRGYLNSDGNHDITGEAW